MDLRNVLQNSESKDQTGSLSRRKDGGSKLTNLLTPVLTILTTEFKLTEFKVNLVIIEGLPHLLVYTATDLWCSMWRHYEEYPSGSRLIETFGLTLKEDLHPPTQKKMYDTYIKRMESPLLETFIVPFKLSMHLNFIKRTLLKYYSGNFVVAL